MTEEIIFPIRINRYLALRGLVTRRAADDLIARGLVLINGQRAELGDRVASAETRVEVLKDKKTSSKKFTYVAYCKPRGVITHSPQGEESSIGDISGFAGLFPLGRLDKASEGLILLTDDVREKILPSVKMIFEAGIENDDERLTAKRVQILGPHTLSIVLTEGKKHQIRRMLDAVHLTVEKLVRTRIMGVHLGALKSGQSRLLKGSARASFLKSIGLEDSL